MTSRLTDNVGDDYAHVDGRDLRRAAMPLFTPTAHEGIPDDLDIDPLKGPAPVREALPSAVARRNRVLEEAPAAFADPSSQSEVTGRSLSHRLVESRLPVSTGRPAGSTRRRSPREDLRGKVVLVDFWTYTCMNWVRTLGYIRAWPARPGDQSIADVRRRGDYREQQLHR
jgi:hypothetical protein